ncbi:MAG: hypothetical protein AAGE86_00250 [Pseudomonadota bacterium]
MSYISLRDGVELLAAPANEQVERLDHWFREITGGGSAEAYGNYELLAGYCEDVIAMSYLVQIGQVTNTEADAMLRLDTFIGETIKDEDFYERDALFSDPRWEGIRIAAREVLAELPDKSSDTEWMKKFFGQTPEEPIA